MKNNSFRKSINIIIVVVIFLISMAGGASAADCGAGTAKPVCECGDTVIGDFTFTGDMTRTDPTQHGLTIGADDIVIDGAGYTLSGTVAGTDCAPWDTGESYPAPHCGIVNFANKDNVVIKDLQIENFCTGIALGRL